MTVRWTVRAAEDRARSSRENRVPDRLHSSYLNQPTVKSPCSTNAYFVRGATASEFARLPKRFRNYIASQYARVQGKISYEI